MYLVLVGNLNLNCTDNYDVAKIKVKSVTQIISNVGYLKRVQFYM